jgi:hypothetical protein
MQIWMIRLALDLGCAYMCLNLSLSQGHPRTAREQGKATDLEALRELAQQRGYKRGWAERVYQARLAKRHGI